jgi:hypothetical protein
MFDELIPSRSVEDILAGRLSVSLGGTTYVLPELAMEATDEWAQSIDERLRGLLSLIDNMGEGSGMLDLFTAAAGFQDDMLDTLIAFDTTSVLPSRAEIRKLATHTQLMFALMGVWASTKSPLAATVVAVLRSLPTQTGTAPVRISRSSAKGTGRRAKPAAA